jgi:glycosyltransferase involved in cell wall biosynthesis
LCLRALREASRAALTMEAESPGVRIVYMVTRADPVGGAQIHVRDLATAVRAQGHSPTVITSGNGPLVDDLRSRGIPVVLLRHLSAPMRPLRDLRALREMRAVLADLRPDLLSAHSAKAGILGRLAARSLQVPVVVTVHGWACAPGTPPLQAAMSRTFERLLKSFASKVITVSEFDRRFGIESHLVTENQVVTVHNGMPDVGSELRADPARSPVRMVMIARFEPQKDHTTLFQALSGLKQEPWHLDLIGDGPLLSQAQELGQQLGLIDRIQFWGQRMDVATRLAEAQVALLISNWEGFPRSILEAMRAGLPVVASAVGGTTESVRDGETGFTVARGDVEGLRNRLKRLLSDSELRSRMGRSGRQRYEQHFTLNHTVEKTLAVYREMVPTFPLRSAGMG